MTILSVLRKGDTRFMPLLLQKVHDVLPTLANPMLQSVPDTPELCGDMDIFDGFGNAGMAAPTNFGMQSRPDYKLENHNVSYDKRVDDSSSPATDHSDAQPFSPPSIIPSPMDYPGMSEYAGYPGMSQGMEFKTEFDATNMGVRRPPLRSDSNSSYGMQQHQHQHQHPRSVPEFQHIQHGRTAGGPMCMNGMNNLPFR